MSVKPKNKLLPLHFHDVHGKSIKFSKNKTVASRSNGFSNAIVFSDRPITIGEPIYVKVLEISENYSGALRIGFTMNDPVSLESKLPEYLCPNLTSLPGNWAKAVPRKYGEKELVLYYYVDESGDVHYGTDTEDCGIIFGEVNTSSKLWAVLDIYGNTVAVEFLTKRNLSNPSCLYQNYTEDCLAVGKVKYDYLQPLLFNHMHGKNVTLNKKRNIATKKVGPVSLAYVFTDRPMQVDKTILMKVTQSDCYCEGLLLYGLTSCNPQKMNPLELPENAYHLLNRSEYWIVKQKSYAFKQGDSVMFTITNKSQVEVIVNNDKDSSFSVDCSRRLWLFVNLTHSVAELNLCGVYSPIKSDSDVASETAGSSSVAGTTKSGSGHQPFNECIICCEEQVDCVLYRCGHACMCFDCASKLLYTSTSSAHCPVCRENVHDIIKIYM